MVTDIARRGWGIAALAGAALIAAGASGEAQERALDGWTFTITTSLEQTAAGGNARERFSRSGARPR